MFEKIKTFIKKLPFLYIPLYFVKSKIISPILTGHFNYFLIYIFTIKKNECKKLNSLGFDSIKPFLFLNWRIGKESDHAFRRYYLAVYNGQKCFVKIGQNDATVHNEYLTLSKIPSGTFDFSPNMLFGKEDFDENTTLLAVEFIENLQKFTCPEDYRLFDHLCSQFLHILIVLEKQNLVHADIHKGNLMLCGDKLYLLDYGISMFKNLGNNINYIARPGTFYRTVEDGRIYDDSYSFTKLIETLKTDYSVENSEVLQAIYQRIDINSFKVTL